MLDNLIISIGLVASPEAMIALVVGTVLGIVVGALPGLGSVVGITMILPFTTAMGQVPGVALMLGVYCGSVFGGSISAILINTPGTPASAATCLDGFPMTQRGEGDLALGWATGASLFGGIFSIVVLMIAAPQLAALALRFGPIEYFALMVFALTCIASVSEGSMAKGLLMGMIGLFLGVVGPDPVTGDIRFDFGIFQLSGGIGLIPIVVGAFALSEVFYRAAQYSTGAHALTSSIGFRFAPPREWLLRWKTFVKSAAIGSTVGVLPGTGAATAAFISYSEIRRSSPRRQQMGKGEPDGVIASETANNAVTGGALVPTLALGIPGDPVTAVMLGTLVYQGVTPGPRLFGENISLVYAIFICLLLANVLMAVLVATVGGRLFSRILRIPEPLLLSMVTVLALVGAYGVNNRMFDVMVALCAGVVAVLLRHARYPIAPMVIGMVIGPLLEQRFRQGLIISDNNFLAFFTSPIANIFFVLTLLFVLKATLWRSRRSPT
ncbi:MAG: tripartite tricarboxylate transporter permease [Aquisalimonadaceae bacterium]